MPPRYPHPTPWLAFYKIARGPRVYLYLPPRLKPGILPGFCCFCYGTPKVFAR